MSSVLERNVLKGNAESTVKQFQSLLTNLGSNNFNHEEKESFIIDGISSFFENEKVRITNDIEPQGSDDYPVEVYLKNIAIWFPSPSEVFFQYTIDSISDVFISDDYSFVFVKVEATRGIDGTNNDNTQIKNTSKLDVYIKFLVAGGQIKRKARVYSITKHTDNISFTLVAINDKYKDDIENTATINDKKTAEPNTYFEAFPLACTKLNCKTTTFKSEDDFYLYFKGSFNGYVSVFLDDGKNSYKLLPYSLDSASAYTGMPAVAGKEYILFSTEPQFNYNANNFFVEDSYQLVSESNKDINHLIVIYSKTPLNKIAVSNNTNVQILSKIEIKKGYKIPQSLTSLEFQNWMNKNINNQEGISLKNIEIAILK